jgi:hypothetical protein
MQTTKSKWNRYLSSNTRYDLLLGADWYRKTNAILNLKREEKLEIDWDLLLERFYKEPQELAPYSDYGCTIKVNDNIAVTLK